MNSSKPHNFIIIAFILLLLIVPVYWISFGNNPDQESLIEGRELEAFSLNGLGFKLLISNLLQGNLSQAGENFHQLFVQGSFQKMIERASTDQFPLRLNLIWFAKEIDRQVIRSVYQFLPDPAFPTDMHSGFYILRDESVIIYGPDRFDEKMKEIIDTRIENYEVLIKTYPDLNFYVYHLERSQSSQWNPLNPFFPEADAGQALDYFIANKPADLTMEKLFVKSFEEYYQLYFRADHHWNIHGVKRAYEDIYQMMKQNYPEITEKTDLLEVIRFPDIEYLGYTARNSFYPIEGDVFEVFAVDLPDYELIRNGTEEYVDYDRDYLIGNYSTEPYVDHYGKYYGHNAGLLEFVFENNPDRNLLIIGDSFLLPIRALLASHYHHTYVINPSRYGEIHLSTLLADYKINDILLLGGNNIIFSDPSLIIYP